MKRTRTAQGASNEAREETSHCELLAHDATTASPSRKKPRLGGEPVDEEARDEWNLLSDLPYVALRCLLDFLSSTASPTGTRFRFRFICWKLVFSLFMAEGSGLVLPGVPELCRVRAENALFLGRRKRRRPNVRP